MNTKHKSLRKFCLLFLCLGCTSTSASNQTSYDSAALKEVSYKQDQAIITEAREKVPEEIREANNTKSYILSFFADRTKDPNVVRSNFSKDLVKKRSQSQDILKKERDQFNASEKKERDKFLVEQKKNRDAFMKANSKNREKIKENYVELESKRKEFFAIQKERRDDFSSKQTAMRKELDAYFKDLRGSFDEEWKLYKEEHKVSTDAKKQEQYLRSKATRSSPSTLKNSLDQFSPEVQKLILELDEMHKKPGEDL
jgi:hypothetical protein